MELRLMIEGQEGVSWNDWVALAEACDECGKALFRSDHYLGGQERETHDAWATLAALAARTERIRLGTLVSPVTFRHPAELAKQVVTVDHVSGGRVELGLGAGWNEREHAAFGFPFPNLGERMELLEEQLAIVTGLWTEERFSFEGKHYRLDDSPCEPKPVQRPRPPIVMGGAAGPRAVRLAVQYADEYNTFLASMDEIVERRARVVEGCERAGRDPATLPFSVMVPVAVGADSAEVQARVAAIAETFGLGDPDELVESRRGRWVLGTTDEALEHLRALDEAGVERVYLQHLAHEDLELVRFVGAELLPRLP
jgi:F420-dependent oxidoreductase-like protein